MLCVITHIRNDVIDKAYGNNKKQVNNVTKKLFYGLSEEELYVTLDLFWSAYNDFNHKNGTFDGVEYICRNKDIINGISHIWNQKYSLLCIKVFGFVACRFTSKVLGIGAAGSSWGDVKTIKSGKNLLSSVMYQINITLFINMPVFNQI